MRFSHMELIFLVTLSKTKFPVRRYCKGRAKAVNIATSHLSIGREIIMRFMFIVKATNYSEAGLITIGNTTMQ